MATFILRVWLPDRPGALGQVASRVGAVGGDLVGIDILERGGGRAIDELVIDLPSDDLVGLMITEISQVDGVDVEDVRPAADALRDPRLDALETAAILVGAETPDESVQALCEHAVRTLGAEWGVVVDADIPEIVAAEGQVPDVAWLCAYLEGSSLSARVAPNEHGHGSDDVAWAPLPGAGTAFAVGRSGMPFRARERRQVAALARIVDARFRDLRRARSRAVHPSMMGLPEPRLEVVGLVPTGIDATVALDQSVAQVRAFSTARSHRP